MPRKVAILTALVLFASCSHGPKHTGPLSYSATARKNYRKGVRALKKKDFEEAKKYFEYVREKFVLSKYVVLAELRLADLLYKQGKFLAAAEAYRNFIKDHPGHPDVLSGYVPFRLAMCHWKAVPTDWWLLPPAYEKDLTAVEAAAKAFRVFLDRFPNSKYSSKARKYYDKAVQRLAEHELYVAKFYLSRHKPKGAILRLEGLMKRYPDARFAPSVLLLLGRTYLEKKDYSQAKKVFEKLAARHPGTPQAKRARLYLRFIHRQRRAAP